MSGLSDTQVGELHRDLDSGALDACCALMAGDDEALPEPRSGAFLDQAAVDERFRMLLGSGLANHDFTPLESHIAGVEDGSATDVPSAGQPSEFGSIHRMLRGAAWYFNVDGDRWWKRWVPQRSRLGAPQSANWPMATALLSPDGQHWWDGRAWNRVPGATRPRYSNGKRLFYSGLWALYTVALMIGAFTLIGGGNPGTGAISLVLACATGLYSYRIWTYQAKRLWILVVF